MKCQGLQDSINKARHKYNRGKKKKTKKPFY